ncbi:MAG: glycosyltransferase [Oscillospiraceae bacterium]|nr:glycosyltransferase [Oscillospiraceae bacterium]
MKEKIYKIISVIKKDGFLVMLRKSYQYIKANYIIKINIFQTIYINLNAKKYKKIIDDILDGDYDRVIIWRSTFGWNVPLFQRPQHISRNLAQSKCLVFYEVTTMTDKVKDIAKIENNLHLINFNNRAIKKLLMGKLQKVSKPKYVQIYSTNAITSVDDLMQYMKDGYRVIYEYIDDLSPALLGTKELPKNLTDKYEYILKDKENVFVVVTADEIEKDILTKRGKEKLVFSCNGVDYEHFQNIDREYKFGEKFEAILKQEKPIVGYYGALASWFDYEMVRFLALQRPEYNVVLIGIKYDDTWDKQKLDEVPNIHFLGPRDYSVLKNYADKFTVCTIPFVINEITEATSPLKLFEYMALSKPIVTSNMKECRKYESVFIAKSNEEYVKLIDKTVDMERNKKENEEYFELLEKEALENTWNKKAEVIIDLLKENEE